MNSERVKKQQVPKDDRSAIPSLQLSHLYLINSFMHSNWSQARTSMNSGKLAEKSYHQNSKTLLKNLKI